jgi:hypothetical protein
LFSINTFMSILKAFTIKHKIFLEWWWFLCVLVLTGFITYELDVIERLWTADQTKISFAILFLFFLMTIYCGIQAWQLSKINVNKSHLDPTLKHKYEAGWFVSEMCLTMGLIGTVAGFILMLYGAFADINISDTVSVQESLKKMSLGMSTALYTTMVGLISSLLLKVQYFRLESYFEKQLKLPTNEKRLLQD